MQLYRWFDREFVFDLPVWIYPNVVERVRGGPARLEELVRPLARVVLTERDGDKWSIQEHAGHLWDVETLWEGRLEDFEAARHELRPADLENRKTHEADHNANDIDTVLEGFRSARQNIVARLDSYDEALVARPAIHPRLQQPMRVLDLAFFVAEHDDHHLARISQLIRAFAG
jgi:uncharacterized damage-inducible protein DinB